jgi:DNA-binding NarL/FixJ family response regulator
MNEDRLRRDQPKVVIFTADQATRMGAQLALEADGIRVPAGVSSFEELMRAVERHKPDVCLVDADSKDGLRAAAAVVVAPTVGAVVVLTADTREEAKFLSAMRVGANGYVDKSVGPESLLRAVRAVVNGEAAIPRSLVFALLNKYRERPQRHLSVPEAGGVTFTVREWEVLEALRSGFSTREIAERLFISEVTVRRHVGAVVKKLHVDSRAAALELLKSA